MPDNPTWRERDTRDTRDTIIQIVEQIKGLRHEISEHDASDKEMYRRIESSIKSLRTDLETKYVTKEELTPTKAIAYGIVSVFMLAVLTAIAALVVMGGKGRIAP